MSLIARSVAFLTAIVLLDACDIFTEERRLRGDAGEPAPDACPRSECRVWPDYEDLGMVDSGAFLAVGRPPIQWGAHIPGDCDPKGVYIHMELVEDRGTFQDGIQPGSYVLGEADLDIETCSICLSLVADNLSDDARCFFGSGGVLNLSSTEDRLVGSLEELTFGPVPCLGSPPVESSCSSQIGHLAFDTVIGTIEN